MMTLSAQADLIRLYLAANEGKLVWSQMQSWTVPEGWEQQDWQEIIDKVPIEAFKEAGNCKIEGYPTTAIKDIRTQHDKKTLAVSGKIVALSDVEPDPETVPIKCMNCGEIAEDEDAKKCAKCGYDELEPMIAEAKNMQVYRLQEGNILLSAVAKDDNLLYVAKPGHHTYAFGVLKHRAFKDGKTGQIRYRKYIELAAILSNTNSEISYSAEDMERFAEMAKDPMLYQLLVESWAPHLHGLIDAKELCLIVTASKGIARPLNGLLGGPPATGKTQLIIFSTMMTPNGQFINTMNMTMAGLTVASVTDPETQAKLTQLGALALADGDVVGITEFQAIKDKHNEKIGVNDVLERKEVASSKVDGTIRVPARCAVLIDTNNYRADWDYSLSLAENLKYLQPNVGAFISRMDLISITERITDPGTLKAIAELEFKSAQHTEDRLAKYMDDYEVDGIPHYGINTLRKYIAYVTSMPLPTLDASLMDKFSQNYIEANSNNHDFLVDGRYNPSIITIAKVRARLLLKPQVEEIDLLEAIRMVNKSKDIETKTAGGRDSGILVGVPDKQKMNLEDTFWEVVKLCTKKRMDYWQGQQQEIEYASETEILYELTQTHKWPDHKARKYLAKAKKDCLLLESYGQGKLVKA